MPPGEVVVSGQEALEEARGPSPATVPSATVVPALPRPEPPRVSRQAAAARDPAAQAQPPGPGARLHARGRSPQPGPPGSVALSAPLLVAGPRERLPPACGPSPQDGPRDRWVYAGGMNGAGLSVGTRAKLLLHTRHLLRTL